MKLNVIGPIMEGAPNITGYANHIKSLSLALIKQGVDLAVEAVINPQFMELYEPELVKAMKKDYNFENSLIITRPETWPVKLSDRPPKTFGYLVFEGSRIPFAWNHVLKKHAKEIDGVIVPSEHVKDAVGKIEIPLHVIPEGVNTKIFKPAERKANDRFEFLFVGGWAKGIDDRKGLDIALKAYINEFSPKEKVIFSAKINTAYKSMEKIAYDLNHIGINNHPSHPEYRFNWDTLSDELLALMYQRADCFVMPTKAEGFGLKIAEAMACGLPTIATNYGGHLDYFNEKVGYPIKIEKMIKATDPSFLYWDAEWAMPSVEHLQEQMRYVFDNQAEARKKSRKAVKNMQKFTWSESAKKIINLYSQ